MERLVVVTGAPGSGKTTLARPLARLLGVPMVAKDTIKEALLEALAPSEHAAARRLGAAAYEVMFALGRDLPAAVYEANFGPETAGPRLLSLCARPIEVYCRCPPDEALRRYEERAPERHPGHFDREMLHELRTTAGAASGPLCLGGPVLEVDTTGPVDAGAVAAWVRSLPEWAAPEASAE